MVRRLVDAGNTRIRWLDVADGEWLGQGSVVHRGRELGAALDEAWGGLQAPAGVIVGAVLPAPAREALAGWVEARWGVAPEWVQTRAVGWGVRCAYADPSRLGVDRWAALVAARHRGPGAKVVLDAGSACTLDLLAADGTHLGGAISPGLELMRQALESETGLDPMQIDWNEAALPAASTTEAVAAGAMQALAGLAAAGWQWLQGQGPGGLALLTGGDAGRLAPWLPGQWQVVPELVLEGLEIMATTPAGATDRPRGSPAGGAAA